MKPNPKQIAAAKFLVDQASFHATTNDIHSPSHWTDIEECGNMLEWDGPLTEEEAQRAMEVADQLRVFLLSLTTPKEPVS